MEGGGSGSLSSAPSASEGLLQQILSLRLVPRVDNGTGAACRNATALCQFSGRSAGGGGVTASPDATRACAECSLLLLLLVYI